MFTHLLSAIQKGNRKALARCISLIENEIPGYQEFLQQLPVETTPVIGITGPPGAGKSTLTDALIAQLISAGESVGVLCIDPSSPFNRGAILGDRIRMSQWYSHPNVFIRSLASRGALGGLHPKAIEITDTMKAAGFDYIIVETVGVGQSEVEIAGLADITVVVLVPEAGDEVQTMKAGLMEIADMFVVNKADRPDADLFVKNLRQMLAPAFTHHQQEVVIIKTVASTGIGITDWWQAIQTLLSTSRHNTNKDWLLAEKAYQLIQAKRMEGINKLQLQQMIAASDKTDFNLYRFVNSISE